MKKPFKLVLNIVLLSSITLNINGCATMLTGTSQDIKIASVPDNSDIKIEQMGSEKSTAWTGKTPATASLKKKYSYLVTLSHEGYETIEVPIDNSHQSLWTAGDLVLGGIILGFPLVAIDNSSGGSHILNPETINATLVKLPPLQTSQQHPLDTSLDKVNNKPSESQSTPTE